MLKLNFGLRFKQLYSTNGLENLDNVFLNWLHTINPELKKLIENERKYSVTNSINATKDHFLQIAIAIQDFLGELFQIKQEIANIKQLHEAAKNIQDFYKIFIRKNVAYLSERELENIAQATITLQKYGLNWQEDSKSFEEHFIALSQRCWQQEHQNSTLLNSLLSYAHWAIYNKAGQERHKGSNFFSIPKKINHENLLGIIESNASKSLEFPINKYRSRSDLSLNDVTKITGTVNKEAHYCLYCHNRERDYCSKGMPDPKNKGNYAYNLLGIELKGCPLDQKISEMNILKIQGNIIASLAIITLDNPMVAATGHRICNDCMKSCIFQKQQPVNVPMIETQILDDVLNIPWGFEIYSLLTRWNPLNFKAPFPKSVQQKHKVLVVGMGPAGFTLAHYLLNNGIIVVGIDGLKIEPLPPELSGMTKSHKRCDFIPIHNVESIFENLSTRIPYGLGGVMEYGITARWNKNYLKLIRILLERRENFRIYDSTRFGSSITHENAQSLGFDHIALATGSGRPKLPKIINLLAKGVRTASEFLMSLHLYDNTVDNPGLNIQIRLPIVVIGGGLTAIDTATESLTYYCIQIEKFLRNYELLGDEWLQNLNTEDQEIAIEFIEHARLLKKFPEKQRELLHKWGGVTILYRKKLSDSPAYRLNHEEIIHAIEEGIKVIEHGDPYKIAVDANQNCKGVHYISENTDHHLTSEFIPAHSILIATGSVPNTTLIREYPTTYKEENGNFKFDKESGFLLDISTSTTIKMSCFGDLHNKYSGSVVKAMASAKLGYKEIIKLFGNTKANSEFNANDFFSYLNEQLIAKIVKVTQLAPKVVEITIRAPLSANACYPGQFFRLQSYNIKRQQNHQKINNFNMIMEPIALTGAEVDKKQGIISLIILEAGASSKLCTKIIKPGDPISLMGPTGSPTFIPHNQNILLIGGGLGNATLLSVADALKAKGCKILQFCGYKKAIDIYKKDKIEKNADVIVWCCEQKAMDTVRDQDLSFKGNILDAMKWYHKQIFQNKIQFSEIDRIIVVGSADMMAAVTEARYSFFQKVFQINVPCVVSANSPMQCMLKEICAQCIQRHYNSESGKEEIIYSCLNQDQNGQTIDFGCLKDRLNQNSLIEKQTDAVFNKKLSNRS